MNILIVESVEALALLWRGHLERQGAVVTCVATSDAAIEKITEQCYDVIVLDLVLQQGSALAVADFAEYRKPGTNVIFVTDTTFFSDGSLFAITPNARALVRTNAPPEDLAAMVEHFARAS